MLLMNCSALGSLSFPDRGSHISICAGTHFHPCGGLGVTGDCLLRHQRWLPPHKGTSRSHCLAPQPTLYSQQFCSSQWEWSDLHSFIFCGQSVAGTQVFIPSFTDTSGYLTCCVLHTFPCQIVGAVEIKAGCERFFSFFFFFLCLSLFSGVLYV